MTRLALLFSAAALLATPALAGSYSARPLTPPAAAKIIGRDISWSCGAGTCSGRTETSRPLVLCQDLAKHAGKLESFTSDGVALNGADLAKCNAAAKDRPPTSLARAN